MTQVDAQSTDVNSMPSEGVSVIIPAYNQVQWLGEAIQSALDQDHPVCEVIVVDDGSPDNSADLAASFGGVVRVIRKQNAGLSAARNTGILASRGGWLVFIDSDDVIPPNFVSAHLATADKHGADVLFAGSQHTDVEGNVIAEPAFGGMLPGENMLTALLRGNAFPPHAAITRRAAIENAGNFDTTLTSYEDWEFWLRLAFTGATFAPTPGLIVPYRQHPASMSTNAQRMYRNGLAVIQKLRSSDSIKRRMSRQDKRILKNAEWGIRHHYFRSLLKTSSGDGVLSKFNAYLKAMAVVLAQHDVAVLFAPLRHGARRISSKRKRFSRARR